MPDLGGVLINHLHIYRVVMCLQGTDCVTVTICFLIMWQQLDVEFNLTTDLLIYVFTIFVDRNICAKLNKCVLTSNTKR